MLWAMPAAISSASPAMSSGRMARSALRIGMRLRRALGWCCWPATCAVGSETCAAMC